MTAEVGRVPSFLRLRYFLYPRKGKYHCGCYEQKKRRAELDVHGKITVGVLSGV